MSTQMSTKITPRDLVEQVKNEPVKFEEVLKSHPAIFTALAKSMNEDVLGSKSAATLARALKDLPSSRNDTLPLNAAQKITGPDGTSSVIMPMVINDLMYHLSVPPKSSEVKVGQLEHYAEEVALTLGSHVQNVSLAAVLLDKERRGALNENDTELLRMYRLGRVHDKQGWVRIVDCDVVDRQGMVETFKNWIRKEPSFGLVVQMMCQAPKLS